MKTEDALDILDVLITTNYRDGYIGEQALWARRVILCALS